MVSWGPPTGATPDPIIDRALLLHRSRLAASKLDAWPDIWAGHWAGDRLLGELITSHDEIHEKLVQVGTPYACPETTDSVLIWSAPQPEADSDAAFLIVHLSETSHTESYRMGYAILFGGITVYDIPEQYSIWDPAVNVAVLTLLQTKGTVSWNFDEAVSAIIDSC